MRFRRHALAAALASATVMVTTSLAAAAVPTGSYKASGAISFTFTLIPGTCASAPTSLTNPKAPPGGDAPGSCYRTMESPPIAMHCPGTAKLHGQRATIDAGFAAGYRLSPQGTLHFRRFDYASGIAVVGSTEVSLTVHGATATGFVRVTSKVAVGARSVTCDSGKHTFTAHRR